jgi:hypothetical protein
MKTHFIPFLSLLLATLGWSGCSTFESRALEHETTFNALPAASQERLRQKIIEVGDTPEMVYIAWGTPDRKSTIKNASGTSELWSYFVYRSRYAGSAVWFRTSVFYDAGSRGYISYAVPTWETYYDSVPELRRQATFVEGKVAEVVQ